MRDPILDFSLNIKNSEGKIIRHFKVDRSLLASFCGIKTDQDELKWHPVDLTCPDCSNRLTQQNLIAATKL